VHTTTAALLTKPKCKFVKSFDNRKGTAITETASVTVNVTNVILATLFRIAKAAASDDEK
jgi:hypothetical protein